MSVFGQDLQRLLVSFLPCLGQQCRCHPGPLSGELAWPPGPGSGWEHTLRPLCLHGGSDLPQGFGTALGSLGVASSLLLTPRLRSLHS